VSLAYDDLVVCLHLLSASRTADESVQEATVLGTETGVAGVHGRIEDAQVMMLACPRQTRVLSRYVSWIESLRTNWVRL
jgi:hypothetical protein